jgi:hypothetical protein
MDEVIERQQIKFSIQTLAYQINDMAKTNKTHLFYSEIVEGDRQYKPCVLRKHLTEVIVALQRIYRGVYVISRTLGGLVVDKM